MEKTYQLILLILTICSCGQFKKEPTKSKYEILFDKQKHLDTLNQNEAEKLSKSINANNGWETIGKFTYALQDSLESDPRPISFTGRIKDIIKKDSLYILKVVNTRRTFFKKYVAEISVDKDAFQILKSKLNSNKENEGCFIFQVRKVSSYLPILKSEIDFSSEDIEDASSYLTLDFDESLVKLQGKLVTYFLYEHAKEEDD